MDAVAQGYFRVLGDAIKRRDHGALAVLVPDPEQRKKLYRETGLSNPAGTGPFTGLGDLFRTQAAVDPNDANALAATTGGFANQISGIQYTAFNPDKILKQFPGLLA